MNIEQLHYFIHAVEVGSINAAAPKFYLTPQAMNASLRRLEKEFGCELLERNKKGLQLTPQGSLFLEYAQRVLSQYEQMQSYLQDYNTQKENISGTISVYASSVFSEQFLPGQISKFTQVYPNALVKIVMAEAKNILNLFEQGYSRVALLTMGREAIEDYLAENKNLPLRWLPLLEDEIVLCAQNNHPLLTEKFISLDLLEKYIKEENGQISFYHVLTSKSTVNEYARAVCASNTLELHKNLILEHGVVTCMPKMAYRHQFTKEEFAAIPVESKDAVVHGLLYLDDPQDDEHDLIVCFVNSVQRHFILRYGGKL